MSTLPKLLAEHGYLIASSTALAFYGVFAGGYFVGGMRGKAFGKEWVKKPEVQALIDTHNAALTANDKDKAPVPKFSDNGYPDMGMGRYSNTLSYKDWYQFNNAQRVHYNLVENIASIITLHLCAGVQVQFLLAQNSAPAGPPPPSTAIPLPYCAPRPMPAQLLPARRGGHRGAVARRAPRQVPPPRKAEPLPPKNLTRTHPTYKPCSVGSELRHGRTGGAVQQHRGVAPARADHVVRPRSRRLAEGHGPHHHLHVLNERELSF